jgi:ribose 5-phosphate isomerase B
MSILIASDHAGWELKNHLIEFMSKNGVELTDLGTNTPESVDYPDYAHRLCSNFKSQFGILICGSGNGMCMAANKWQGIRAALCWDVDTAQLARAHNNANVICLPARFLCIDDAVDILTTFLETDFEGGRHIKRMMGIDIANNYV